MMHAHQAETESLKVVYRRRSRRELKQVTDFFHECLSEFIQYKNKNFAEYRGTITLHPDVFDKLDEIENQWKRFISNFQTNNQRSVHYTDKGFRFNITALRKKALKHIESHKQLCYINYLGRELKNVYGIDPDYELLLKTFKRHFIPADAAVYSTLNRLYMHTLEIPGIRQLFQFPGDISEMTPKQYMRFVHLSLLLHGEIISHKEFLTLLTLELTGIKLTSRYFRLRQQDRDEINSKLMAISAQLESLFHDDQREGRISRALNLSFVKNPMPRIKRWHGPADALQDITFREYRDALDHFREFIRLKNEEDLDRLIAVLYRRKRFLLPILRLIPSWDGRIRCRYNPNTTGRRLRMIKKLPFAVKYGVFLFFNGCEEFIHSGKLEISGNEIDLSILYQGGESSGKGDIGLVGILYALAETKVFGDIEKTDNQNLYDILTRLYQVRKEAMELEEKMKKNGQN